MYIIYLLESKKLDENRKYLVWNNVACSLKKIGKKLFGNLWNWLAEQGPGFSHSEWCGGVKELEVSIIQKIQ